MADPILPRPQARIADGGGTPTREWFDFFRSLLAFVQTQDGDNSAVEAQIAAIIARLEALENEGAPTIDGLNSVQVTGSLESGLVQIQLLNDAGEPGNTYYYGTGPTGEKGWFAVADAVAGADSVVQTIGADGVSTFNLDGDDPAPGALYGYGTNMAGAKGWYRPALFESTGLLSGGVLSINGGDNTKFDVSAAVVGFTDYSSNPAQPTRAVATFGPSLANAVPDLSVIATYVGIQTPGATLAMQSSPFTAEQTRTIVPLGAVISNGTNLIAVNNLPAVMRAGINQIQDLMTAIGPMNLSGNAITAAGASLQVNKSAGVVFKQGANFVNDPDNPHGLPLGALAPASFNYRLSDGTQFTTTNAVDPNNYESPLGTLTAVPASNRFTIQRFTVFTSNLVRVQYGQFVYNTMAEAEAALSTEAFVTEQNIAENGILLCFLIVKDGATDLSDPDQAKFIPASKFGGPVGSGGTSITNTDALPEGLVNLYFTNARAQSAVVTASITNGDTTHSPSGDAVFDALAGKEPAISAGTTAQFWRGDKVFTDTLRGPLKIVMMASATALDIVSYGNPTIWSSGRANGTEGSPTAVASGNNLMRVAAVGYDGSSFLNPARIEITVDGTVSSGVIPTRIDLRTGDGSGVPLIRWQVKNDGHLLPGANNAYDVGNSSVRPREYFGVNGTINTSDAREKTTPRALTADELAAAVAIARLPCIFQWLHAVAEKGDSARLHCSPTVQSVIATLQDHGLDPFRYGFVCHDEWGETPEVLDPETGEVLQDYRPAGDLYSLRPTELAHFILSGVVARQDALEKRLTALGG